MQNSSRSNFEKPLQLTFQSWIFLLMSRFFMLRLTESAGVGLTSRCMRVGKWRTFSYYVSFSLGFNLLFLGSDSIYAQIAKCHDIYLQTLDLPCYFPSCCAKADPSSHQQAALWCEAHSRSLEMISHFCPFFSRFASDELRELSFAFETIINPLGTSEW